MDGWHGICGTHGKELVGREERAFTYINAWNGIDCYYYGG
jgi:hypothetical protein